MNESQRRDAQANAPVDKTAVSAGVAEGVSQADITDYWNQRQNQNYMAGDGPAASITVSDGQVQSVSSVNPELRDKSLEDADREDAPDTTNPGAVGAGQTVEGREARR